MYINLMEYSMITHMHHIIPRHMGGTNDPSNLKEVTIAEHAEEHRKLYEQCGREEDKIAWKCLSGQITNAEANILAVKAANTGRKKTPEENEKRSKTLKGMFAGEKNPMYGRRGKDHPQFGKSQSEEVRQKIRERAIGSKKKLSPEVKAKKALVVAENSRKFFEKKFSHIDFFNAQELYDTGMSYKDLAKHYGVSTGKIQGLKLKPRSYSDAGKIRFKNNPVSEETIQRMSQAAILVHKSRKY